MERYNVSVTVAGHGDVDIDQVIDDLVDYHPTLSDGAPPATMRALLTVPGETLRQAIITALSVVTEATGGQPVGCKAMTEVEFDRQAGFPPVPNLVSTTEAASMLGVSRQSVQAMYRKDRLRGKQVGAQLVFSRAEVERVAVERGEAAACPT